MAIITIDGVRTEVKPPVVEEYINGFNAYNGDRGTQDIVQPTELGESLRELNSDSIDPISRMSGIDLRSNLHPMEIPGILAVDTLVAFHFLPLRCLSFTRKKMRVAVSQGAFGRKNIVDVISGKQRHEEQMGSLGYADKAKNFLGLGGQ